MYEYHVHATLLLINVSHVTHHAIDFTGDMKSNLAMLNLGLDGMMHSLSVLDPEPLLSAPLSSSPSGFYSTLVTGKNDGDFPDGISASAVNNHLSFLFCCCLLCK